MYPVGSELQAFCSWTCQSILSLAVKIPWGSGHRVIPPAAWSLWNPLVALWPTLKYVNQLKSPFVLPISCWRHIVPGNGACIHQWSSKLYQQEPSYWQVCPYCRGFEWGTGHREVPWSSSLGFGLQVNDPILIRNNVDISPSRLTRQSKKCRQIEEHSWDCQGLKWTVLSEKKKKSVKYFHWIIGSHMSALQWISSTVLFSLCN